MRRLPQLTLASLLVAFGLGIVLLGDLTRATGRFLLLYAGMFVVYGVAVALVDRLRWREHLRLVVTAAILVRVLFCVAQPSLSTDIYRYLWEGRVIAAARTLFQRTPDATRLEHLRDDNYERVNHPHLATIYPPGRPGGVLARRRHMADVDDAESVVHRLRPRHPPSY